MNIQLMQIKDIPIMEQLAKEIWREYSICFISAEQIEYMLEKFQSEIAIKEQLSKAYEYYFLQENFENIGYFAIQPQDDFLFLSKIYIKKGYRNKGIGKKALAFIKKRAKELDFNSIELTVNKYNNDTINAYINWGFLQKSEAQVDIGSNFIMDDYILELKL